MDKIEEIYGTKNMTKRDIAKECPAIGMSATLFYVGMNVTEE